MKNDITFSKYLNLLFELENTDVKPTFILMKALFDGFIAAGWSEIETVNVLANLEYRIDQNFIDDGLVGPTVKTYIKLLTEIKKECRKISNLLFDKFIKSNKITITYR